MRFAHFFIERPVFAMVLSIVTVLTGGLSIFSLPIAQYPEIAPPTVTISTNFPGANAQTVAETVATPIEEQVNGVEKMLYMSSQSNNDGSMRLTVTFAVEDSFFWTPAFMKFADTVRGAVPGGRLLSSKDLSNVSNKVLPSAVTLLWTGSNVWAVSGVWSCTLPSSV